MIKEEFEMFKHRPDDEGDFEFNEIDDVDEFSEDREHSRRIPQGYIINQRRGVKKMLPTSKQSFINWRNDANLKSFYSNHPSILITDNTP